MCVVQRGDVYGSYRSVCVLRANKHMDFEWLAEETSRSCRLCKWAIVNQTEGLNYDDGLWQNFHRDRRAIVVLLSF